MDLWDRTFRIACNQRPTVFIGHYGLALAANRAAPRISLGALIFGAQLADLRIDWDRAAV